MSYTSPQENTSNFGFHEVQLFKKGIRGQLKNYDRFKLERFGVKPDLYKFNSKDILENVMRMQTAIIFQAFQDTVEGEKNGNDTEDYVGRYVNMLLFRNFCLLDFGWNIVPQYYTKSKKFPDLVLETWRPLVRGKLREDEEVRNINVPRVYIELKSTVGGNELRALEQAKDAVSLQHGKLYPAQGIIIAVRGFTWLFMEYQFGVGIHKTGIGRQSSPKAIRIKLMAFDHKDPKVPATKPRPIRPDTVPIGKNANEETGDGYQLDMRIEEHEKHCLEILRWISITRAEEGHVRNIAQGQGYSLPSQVTASTLASSLSEHDLAKLNEFEKVRQNEGDENNEVDDHGQDLKYVGLQALALGAKLDEEEEERQAVGGAAQ